MMLVRILSSILFFILLGSEAQANDLLNYTETSGFDKIVPALQDKLEQDTAFVQTKTKQQVFRLVVTLRSENKTEQNTSQPTTSFGSKSLTKAIKLSQNQVISKITQAGGARFKLLRQYQSLYGFSVEADSTSILELAANDEVIRIEEMPVYEKMDSEAFGLTCTIPVHSGNWTGKGVTIAVIDDGIDLDHAAFGGGQGFPNAKIIGGYDFADYDENPDYDCSDQSHGTATSAIAVGNGGGITGTAPDANLVFLKVQRATSCGQSVLDGDIIGALDWIITNKEAYGIKIVSMSMGTRAPTPRTCTETALNRALSAAKDAGLIVLAASGNGADANGLAEPACHPDAVSVGAVYDTSLGYASFRNCTDISTYADLVSCYSNSSDSLDILAPGHCASTAQAGGGVNSCFGGTSSSTPYIAGVMATFFEKSRSLSRSEAIAALLDNGDPVIDPRNNRMTPRVNHGKSMFSLGEEGNEVVRLTNGAGISGITEEKNNGKIFCLNIPAGVPELTIQTTGGSGDADIFIKAGAIPTPSNFDCSSKDAGTEELCTLLTPEAGIYYVLVYGSDDYSGLTLVASYHVPGNSTEPIVLKNGIQITSMTGAEMSNRYFLFDVPVGAEDLKIKISGGSGDVDLHVKYESAPTASSYDCRPYTPGNDEECFEKSPQTGSYYILLQAYSSYSDLTLNASYKLREDKQKIVLKNIMTGPLMLLLK
jgi:hypothetical protein